MNKQSFMLGVFLAILANQSYPMDENLIKKLKTKYKNVITNSSFPNGFPLPEEKDFVEVEQKFGPLHPSHRDFLIRFSDREFERTGYDPFRVNGGIESTLAEKIQEARDAEIPDDWIPFCHADEAYWCIHNTSGKAALFEIYPEVEKTEKLASVNKLIKNLFF